MDYARKIGKQPRDNKWPKLRDCVPQKPCNPQKSITPLQEDRRLANWKRWLADRERRQKYLAAALKREPIDLALNAHEKVRFKQETKCLLESAVCTEVTNQDKYRGNPAFWYAEQRLKKEYDHEDDDVIVKKSKHDKFLPPDITRVALPAYIKKEKMLIEACMDPSKINLNSKWNSGDYLRQRRTQLNREIKYLEPKQPETDDLIIIGRNNDCQENEKFTSPPVITITAEQCKRKLLNDPDDRAALKIQDREFILESSRHFEKLSYERTQQLKQTSEDLNSKRYIYAPFDCERVYEIFPKKCKSITWSLRFVTNNNDLSERSICMENRGVRVVHVEWRKAYTTALPERLDTRFFFNKGRISILPGQKVDLAFWFRANRSIVTTETWKLIVDPKIYPGTLLLRLWGVCKGEDEKLERERNYNSLKQSLERRIGCTKIREIINDLIAIACNESYNGDDMPYEMYFLESYLFQATNLNYHYKSELVKQLKQMYVEITSEQDWNLSLNVLRSSLLKLENPIDRREKFIRFQEICQQCLLPDFYYTRAKPTKEKLVYWLLCMFVNRFEDEDDYVMRCCCREINSDDASEETGYLSEMEDGQSQVLLVTSRDRQVYRQAMYIRIYCLLRETVDKICLAVESCDFF